jgi:hypothetical protein
MIVCNYNVEDDWEVVNATTHRKLIQHTNHLNDRGSIIVYNSMVLNEYFIQIFLEPFNNAYQKIYYPYMINGNGSTLHYYIVSSIEKGKERADEFLNKLQRLKAFL